MAVVVFCYSDWVVRYPALAANVPAWMAEDYFAMATMFLDNTPTSPVQDVQRRAMLLGLILAHLATLYGPGRDATAVGRVSDATEGTVRAAFELATVTGQLEAFFVQTQYGLTYWALTARFRRGRYVAPPRCSGGPFGPGGFGYVR